MRQRRLAELARSPYPLPLASLKAKRSLLSLDNLDALSAIRLESGEPLEFVLAVPGRRYSEFVDLLRPFQATSNLIGTRFVTPFVTAGAMSIGDAELAARAEDYAAYLTATVLPALGDHE